MLTKCVAKIYNYFFGSLQKVFAAPALYRLCVQQEKTHYRRL